VAEAKRAVNLLMPNNIHDNGVDPEKKRGELVKVPEGLAPGQCRVSQSPLKSISLDIAECTAEPRGGRSDVPSLP